MIKKIIHSVLFSKKPAHLILHITNKCNLRCKTCFVDFEKAKNETDLSLNEIKNISKFTGKLLWLDLSGGEPFVRKDLADICLSFDSSMISIPTNGFNPRQIYITTKKIAEKSPAEISISVSIDGFEKTNDEIRSKGYFNKSIETINLLKTIKGVKVKVNTVLCDKNYDELIPFMKFIKSLNVDFHSIVFLRGQARNLSYKLPPYKKLLKLRKPLFEMWEQYGYGVKLFKSKILQEYQRNMYDASLKVINEKKQTPDCLAWKQHLVIYANGNVSFCEMLNPIGNIRKANLQNILESDYSNKVKKSIKDKKCFCHHNCNLIDNFFLNPIHYPKLASGILK